MTLLPPPQYDVTPPMPVIEHVMSLAEVNRYCKGIPPPGMKIWGCALINRTDHKCYIVRIDDWEVARHERAHCAGWPKDHPGGF